MDGNQSLSDSVLDEPAGGNPADVADIEVHGELGPACGRL